LFDEKAGVRLVGIVARRAGVVGHGLFPPPVLLNLTGVVAGQAEGYFVLTEVRGSDASVGIVAGKTLSHRQGAVEEAFAVQGLMTAVAEIRCRPRHRGKASVPAFVALEALVEGGRLVAVIDTAVALRR
jgi:hypothetical protein